MRALIAVFDGKRQSAEHWSRYGFYWFFCLNGILLTLVLFDAPLASGRAHFSPLVLAAGRSVTDYAKSGWIIFICGYLMLAGWAAMHGRCIKTERRTAHILTWAAGYVLACVAVSGLTANLLKRVIGRARPALFDREGMLSFDPFATDAIHQSFPSGHATTAAALFVALALLMPRFRGVFLVMGLWLAMARVIVGAHYPSDVLAGLALGAWFSYAFACALAQRDKLFRLDANGWPQPAFPHHDPDRS